MLPRLIDFSQEVEQLFEKQHQRVFTFTFQVTDDCSLRCSYCYQGVKDHHYMTTEMGKKIVDFIFKEAEDDESVLSYKQNAGIIIDFIGGEPLLNIDVVTDIIDYFEQKLIETNSPWLFWHRYTFSSNGVDYFNPKVQTLLKRYKNLLNIGVTVDGCKEIHDTCRVFPNGKGSYDLAMAAAKDGLLHHGVESTKITLSAENIMYLSKAVINMLNNGFKHIHANCVFEDVWNPELARIMYFEMNKLTDYIYDNDLFDKCEINLYDKQICCPRNPNNDTNWCGGTGKMLSVDCEGNFYPCVRYMPNSLNGHQPPLYVGSLQDGLYKKPEHAHILEEFKKITLVTQSTEECINCPIAEGCAWCSGYNYECFGTVNKRATYICIMHVARSLANYYFWKKFEQPIKLYTPMEKALKILTEEELKELMGDDYGL